MLGAAEDTQSKLNGYLINLIENPEDWAKILPQIETLIQSSENASKLTLNIEINHKGRVYPIHDLLSIYRLSDVKRAFLRFKKLYHVQYDPTLFSQSVGFKETAEGLNVGGQSFVSSRKLKGRGQAGLANFYHYENKETQEEKDILVKQDSPGTCLLEGTAYWLKNSEILPKFLRDCVNYASVGNVETKENINIPVSIQDRVNALEKEGKVRAWDEIVYGVKRNPKTLFSVESWYPTAVRINIAKLSPAVQWQLAAAILASEILGDESLHIGQFMALLDAKNNVVGIKRIDLGARERYALRRDKQDISPYHASQEYQKSGQWGKDYVSFLLEEPHLHRLLTLLWVNIAAKDRDYVIDKIREGSRQAIIDQFKNLPISLQEEAIDEVLAIINKKITNPSDKFTLSGTIEEKISALATKLAELDASRVVKMARNANEEFLIKTTQLRVKYAEAFPRQEQTFLERCITLRDLLIIDSAFDPEEFAKLIEELHVKLHALTQDFADSPAKTSLGIQINILSEIALDLLEAGYFRLRKLQDKETGLESAINKFETLFDVSSYAVSPHASKHKAGHCARILAKAMQGEETLIQYLESNPEMVKEMKAHRNTLSELYSYIRHNESQGAILFSKIYGRYHLDPELRLTPQSADLLNAVKGKDFTHVKRLTEGYFNVYDALIPDKTGKTTLHYLMEEGAEDINARAAIVNIFKQAKFGQLDITDLSGKTPLHALMENPSRQKIIEAVNRANIKGLAGLGGQWQIQDFFDRKSYEKETLFEELEGKIKKTEGIIKPPQ